MPSPSGDVDEETDDVAPPRATESRVTEPADLTPADAIEPQSVGVLAATGITFTDVSSRVGSASYSKFATEITWLAQTGITRGWSLANGTREYRPLDTIARDAMAAFLYRYAGEPAHYAPTRSPFLDVKQSTAFYREITWAADAQVSTGWRVSGGAEFRATDAISREAMAAFLYRFAGSPGVNLPSRSPFVDVKTTDPFYRAIVWLSQTGATTGWKTSAGAEYRPRASITRDAMAAFLYRLDRAGVLYNPAHGAGTVLRHSTLSVYGATSLALRTAPGTSSALVAYYPRSTTVTPTGDVSPDGWIEVIIGSARGWMSGYYLRGFDGAAVTRVTTTYANGALPRDRLCPLSWDSSELLLCQAAADLERLNAAFTARFGRTIPVNDSYRDYDEQVRARALYGTMAAIPGTSNHGWAAAIDIAGASLPGGYQGAAYLWLRQQLTAYNWVLPTWARPEGSKPEAWHFEYTG
ncbi:D-alanyl-D-alanine carboxypeptidase family protein [Demequina sp. NBRC 110055]|uniref:D-alanyl-D-alanine carboxypeptidase family protein n=1 Tax=Demequina sp. NBRC 110055 TaxID=1570344 RepID=UPI000A03AE40|nr:D-alanyl-D-alanine carboxypeptidase family protein [Demequina sp. NBRC 110055]